MRVGVIGLGVMGRNHARVLQGMPNVDELELFDPLGDELGVVQGVKVQSSLDRFLDKHLDYCVVSSPTVTHLEIGLALADRRIPTLIEKPLARTSEEGEMLLDAFSAAGVVAGVGHVERFNPAIMQLRDKVEAGLLGELFHISTRRVGPYSGRIRDVGVAMDLATHDIDLARCISGSTYKTLNSRTLKPNGNKHEDLLVAIGTMGNGVLVSHLVNWVSPIKERVTTVLGSKGMFVADTLNADLFHFELGSHPTNWDGLSIFKGTSEGPIHKFELKKNEPLFNEHQAFQDALSSIQLQGVASLLDGLEVLRVAEKIL